MRLTGAPNGGALYFFNSLLGSGGELLGGLSIAPKTGVPALVFPVFPPQGATLFGLCPSIFSSQGETPLKMPSAGDLAPSPPPAHVALFLGLLCSFLVFLPGGGLNAQEEDSLEIGGAVRYNLFFTDYESPADPNDLQFTWDTWRLNVQARSRGVGLRFEYRFYPTFNTHFVKEGWLDYAFSPETEVQVGVTQVPFGNLQYNSHNWWFQLPYYVGLEDDHDMGVKLIHRRDDWSFMGAWFLQPEPAGPAGGEGSFGIGGAGRYSYDLLPTPGESNQEKHQGNLRIARSLSHGPGEEGGRTELGVSLQGGGIWNSVTKAWGRRWAVAGHLDGTWGPWGVKAQVLRYGFSATDDEGAGLDRVQVGAYGDTYATAARATIATLGVQYGLEVERGPLTGVNLYQNYSWMGKAETTFHDSQQHVLGASVAAGALFVYFDLASGRNHPWLTDDFGVGLGEGRADARWNTRFNVNIGFYF